MDPSPVATWTKHQKRGGWKPQKCILWFRRLEAQDQGAGSVVPFCGLRENAALPVELCACWQSLANLVLGLLPVRFLPLTHGLLPCLSVCIFRSVLSFSYKEEEMGWGPPYPSMTSLQYWSHLFYTISNKLTCWGSRWMWNCRQTLFLNPLYRHNLP